MGVLKGLATLAVRAAISSAAKGVAKEVLSSKEPEDMEAKRTVVKNGIRCIEDPNDYLHDGLRCKVTSLGRNGSAVVGRGYVINTGDSRISDVCIEVEYRFENGNAIDKDYITVNNGKLLCPGESGSFSFSSHCNARDIDAVYVGVMSYSENW